MPKKKVTTIFIIATLSALASVFVATFLYYLIISKQSEFLIIENSISALKLEQDASVSMKHLLTDTAEQRKKIDSYFIGSDGIVTFIESIERLSRETSVDSSVNSVGVEQGASAEEVEYVTVNVSAEGSFRNLFWFLSLLEKMPLKIEITKVYFEQRESVDPKKKGTTWRLAFVVKALKFK